MSSASNYILSYDLDDNNTLYSHIEFTKSEIRKAKAENLDKGIIIFYILFASNNPKFNHYHLTSYLSELNVPHEFLFRGYLTEDMYNGIDDKSKINIFKSTMLFDNKVKEKINII